MQPNNYSSETPPVYLRKIAKSFIPDLVPLSKESKNRITLNSASFMKKQVAQQPAHLKLLIHIAAMGMSVFLLFPNNWGLKIFRIIPNGKITERLFRSLLMLIYFEDEEVLLAVNQSSGSEKTRYFRELKETEKQK